MTRVNKVVMVRGFVCCVLVIVARPQMSVAEYDLSSISLAQTNGSMTGSRLESEQLAMELVEAHLPELKTVLASLKKHSHKEYQKAVSDLARTSRRLETLQKRDPTAFEIEVSLLQWQTRADLALAQLQVRDNAKGRAQLKAAVSKREEFKLLRASHERDRIMDRIARMQSQVDRLNELLESTDLENNARKAYAAAVRRLDQPQSSTSRNRKKSKSETESKPSDSQSKSVK